MQFFLVFAAAEPRGAALTHLRQAQTSLACLSDAPARFVCSAGQRSQIFLDVT